ncbi:MAG: hypothetical protein ACTIJ9_00225 [Aequorivita sp.]
MSNQTKKILLKTNEKKIEAINKEAVNSADKLNSLIHECEKVCKTTFSKDERDNIRDAGMKFIKDYFKPKFQFPDADDKLNFQLIGIDLEQLEKTFKGYPIWREYPIEQNDKGVFELVGEPKQIERCYTYTENEKQVRAYELGVKITDLLNTAIEENFIPERSAYRFIAMNGLITANSKQTRAELNTEHISRIK